MMVAVTGGATAGKLITSKQIKNGTITEKDLSKSLRKKLAKAGTPGATGATGAKGDSGPTLVRAGKNITGSAVTPSSHKLIVVIDDDMTDMTYSGNYSGRLTHPTGLSGYMNIVVNGKVKLVTGAISSCELQTNRNGLGWNSLDETTDFPDNRALLFASFPSFTPGDKFAFRIRCEGDGSAVGIGELGVVAGPVTG
jgi:hypothetical protein